MYEVTMADTLGHQEQEPLWDLGVSLVHQYGYRKTTPVISNHFYRAACNADAVL